MPISRSAALATACALMVPIALAQPATAGLSSERAASTQPSMSKARTLSMVPARVLGTRVVRVATQRAANIAGQQRYLVSFEIRAVRRQTRARATVRQVVHGRVPTLRSIATTASTRSWRQVSVPIVSKTPAGRVELWARAVAGKRDTVKLRDIHIVRVSPSPSTAPDTTAWQPHMVENFDSLSSSRWNIVNNWFATNESSYLLARNVSTSAGVLRVQGKLESAGGRKYTSGRIDTNSKYALPNYFRAEIRAKVPYQQGMWSAPLWFRPTGGGSGEIDLVETYGTEKASPKVHQTIHSAYGAQHQSVGVRTPFSRFSSAGGTAWHTYTVEKTRNKIVMWVDGHQTALFTSSSVPWFETYYESGQAWNLRVCLQIGGGYGLPTSATNWTGDNTAMQIDYIKTWVPS